MAKFLIALSFLALIPNAWSALSESDSAMLLIGKNWATNGGAENGKTGWTTSGTSAVAGDLVVTTTAAGKYEGNGAFTWTPHNADNYLTNTSVTITSGGGLSSANCAAIFWTKTTDTTHALEAYDGTNVLNSVTIPSSTAFVPVTLNWVCPASGTVQVRFNAGSTTAISFDSLKWGDARGINISQVTQAQFAGQAYFPVTANCFWTRTNAALGSFGTTSACPGPTIEAQNVGSWQTTDSDLPKWTINSLPPGYYMAIVTGTLTSGNAAITHECVAINDGTTTSGTNCSAIGSANNVTFTTVGYFTYSTAANHTFEVYGSNSANAIQIEERSGLQQLQLSLYRFPTTAETAYRPNVYNWRVDANISGGNYDLGSSDQAAYVSMTNSAMTLTNNTSTTGNVLTAQIPCSTTNPPTGTTCGAGTEDNGVSFTLPVAGDVEACVDFSHFSKSGASGDVSVDFEIVETPSNAQTISQEGKSRIQSGVATASTSGSFPFHLCGIFSFTSSGQKTLRLMYEQDITATVTTNIIFGDVAAAQGQRDIHWVVKPLTQSMPAPVLVQSVTAPQNTAGTTVVNNWVTKSSSYTATSTDETIVFTADSTLTLPAAASYQGKKYHVVSSGSGTDVTIDPNASETVCGATTILIPGTESVDIQSDGTNWIGLNGSCTATRRAVLNCDAGSAITSQGGSDWVSSIGNVSTGTCTVTLQTGPFSATPTCVVSNSDTTVMTTLAAATPASATSVAIKGVNSTTTAALTAYDVSLICQGAR